MPQRAELARPVMRRRTRLHADKTRLEAAEQRQKLIAADLAAKQRPAFAIDAMNLKNILRDIQTDRGNLHVDGSFPFVGP